MASEERQEQPEQTLEERQTALLAKLKAKLDERKRTRPDSLQNALAIAENEINLLVEHLLADQIPPDSPAQESDENFDIDQNETIAAIRANLRGHLRLLGVGLIAVATVVGTAYFIKTHEPETAENAKTATRPMPPPPPDALDLNCTATRPTSIDIQLNCDPPAPEDVSWTVTKPTTTKFKATANGVNMNGHQYDCAVDPTKKPPVRGQAQAIAHCALRKTP